MTRFRAFALTLLLLGGCADAYPPDPSPGDDAAEGDGAVDLPDAAVPPTPDAWTGPACTSWSADVQPLYSRHCATCHTSGRDTRFGSSITVARSASSACGTSMVECTIQLGQVGGQMAYNDPYGGFTTAEIATLRSWVTCGMPN